jgi:hypothetical protein
MTETVCCSMNLYKQIFTSYRAYMAETVTSQRQSQIQRQANTNTNTNTQRQAWMGSGSVSGSGSGSGSGSDVHQPSTPIVKPMVVVLDFDGTLVGDVEWLANEYTIFQENKTAKYTTAHLMHDLNLDRGLIRPYLKEFLIASKQRYPNIEFFIYTASDTEWAEFIIPRVETKLGFKFNRPLFTRTKCHYQQGSYYKSMETIRPIIYKKLARMYKLKSPTDIQSMILIDNTPLVLTDPRVQVNCPTYDYQYPVDITRQIPMGAIEAYIPNLKPILAKDRRFKNMQHFWYYFHRYMSDLYANAYKANKVYLKDQYWKRMTQVFLETDIRVFDSYELKAYLNSR